MSVSAFFICSKNHQGTFGAYNKPGNLVLGLHQGVEKMCVGEIRKVIIPPHLGFGEPDAGKYSVELSCVRGCDLISLVNFRIDTWQCGIGVYC